VVGTTDLDYREPLDVEPAITPAEVAYLMAAVEHLFPSLALRLDDVVATFSGVRPVVATAQSDPSKESREYLVVEEGGLVTAMGGKLTTFQLIAYDALEAARKQLGGLPMLDRSWSLFEAVPDKLDRALPAAARRRLLGRYGAHAAALVAAARPGELDLIPGTPVMWAELRWAARAEGVAHLDDLLLRRVRLGLLLPGGGAAELPRIRAICQGELSWDDERWQAEEERYLRLWRTHYGLPEHAAIPDWRVLLAEARDRRAERRARRRRVRRREVAAAVATVAMGMLGLGLRRRIRETVA